MNQDFRARQVPLIEGVHQSGSGPSERGVPCGRLRLRSLPTYLVAAYPVAGLGCWTPLLLA
jgi:hypothetical protein